MKVVGYVVVIKRSGADGTPYPMVHSSCSIGRNIECDIRVQLNSVSQQQCRIDVDPSGKAYLTNLTQNGQTMLNGYSLAPKEVCMLNHKQVLSVGERKFRWEYPEGSSLAVIAPSSIPSANYKILVPVDKSPVYHPIANRGAAAHRWSIDEMSEAKRKKVSFGPQLNPEHFDKLLPPATPVSKGDKPNSTPTLSMGSSRKSARASIASTYETITENAPETPTKSLLRRRSPTPVKPYLARSLGINMAKLQEEDSSSVHSPERESSEATQAQTTMNTAKSPKVSGSTEATSKRTATPVSTPGQKTQPSPASASLARLTPKTPDTSLCKTPKSGSKISATATPKTSKVELSNTPKSTPKTSPKSSPKTPKSIKKVISTKIAHQKLVSPSISAHTSPKSEKTTPTRGPGRPRKSESPQAAAGRASPNTQEDFKVKVSPKRPADTSPEIPPQKKLKKLSTSPSTAATPKVGNARVPSPKTPKMMTPKFVTPKKSGNHVSPKRLTPKVSTVKHGTPKHSLALTPKSLTKAKNTTSPKGTPAALKSLKALTPKRLSPKTATLKLSTPKKLATPKKLSTPKSVSPKLSTPKKLSAPKSATPKKLSTPKSISPKLSTPKSASPKLSTPKKLSSPKFATPKSASPKLSSPKSATPKKLSSPKSTTSKSATPKKLLSPKSATPKKLSSPKSATPKKLSAPKSTTPKKLSTPKSTTPKKLSTPKSTTPKKLSTPKSATPKKLSTPKSTTPKKLSTPKSATPKKLSTPKSATPKKLSTPKSATPKKLSTPKSVSPKPSFRKNVSPKSTSAKDLSTPKSVSPRNVLSPQSASHKRPPAPRSSPKFVTPKRVSTKAAGSKRLSTPKSASAKTPSTPQFANPEVLASPHSLTPWSVSHMAFATPKFASPEVMAAPAAASPTLTSPKTLTPPQSASPKAAATPKNSPSRSASGKRSVTPRHVSPKRLKTSTTADLKKLTPPSSASPRNTKTPAATPRAAPPAKSATLNSARKRVTIRSQSSATPGVKSGKLSRVLKAKTPKKSWAEVLKKGLAGKRMALSRSQKARVLLAGTQSLHKPHRLTKHSQKAEEVTPVTSTTNASTTGHANSPAPIIIRGKTTRTPKVFRKGQKQQCLTSQPSRGSEMDSCINLDGLATLMSTPKGPVEGGSVVSPPTKTRASARSSPAQQQHKDQSCSPAMSSASYNSNTSVNMTNFDFSAVRTPEVTKDHFVSSLETPALCRTPESVLRDPTDKLMADSPVQVPIESDATTFDFGSAHTPDVTRDEFVSPVSARSDRLSRSAKTFRKSSQDVAKILAIPRTAVSTPKPQVKHSHTPRSLPADSQLEEQQDTSVQENPQMGSPHRTSNSASPDKPTENSDLVQETPTTRHGSTLKTAGTSPQADYTDVAGVKRLLRTPKPAAESPQADYTNVAGMKKLMKTPKPAAESPQADYTNVAGMKKLMKTPKPAAESPQADYTNVAGMKKLLQTPKPAAESPQADYTNVTGMKKLMRTPKPAAESPQADYTDVAGMKRLLRTPKPAAESPQPDYTNVAGMKKLLQTPKPVAESPQADYTNVAGMKKLMKTPKPAAESPQADYTNIAGVGKLLRTPRPTVASPKADYSNVAGVGKLLRTPQPQGRVPEADYTNVAGVKRLLGTPKLAGASPTADYTNVAGVRHLMRSPKTPPCTPETDLTGVDVLLTTPEPHMEDSQVARHASPKRTRKTPLADQTNVDLSQATVEGGKRKVVNLQELSAPSTSPSENIPPSGETEESGIRRSQRNTKATGKETVVTPVRQVRSRKVIEECVLELVQSPVRTTRSLRSTPLSERPTPTRISKRTAARKEKETKPSSPQSESVKSPAAVTEPVTVLQVSGDASASAATPDLVETPVKTKSRGRPPKNPVQEAKSASTVERKDDTPVLRGRGKRAAASQSPPPAANETPVKELVESTTENDKPQRTRGKKTKTETVDMLEEEKIPVVEEVVRATRVTRRRKVVDQVDVSEPLPKRRAPRTGKKEDGDGKAEDVEDEPEGKMATPAKRGRSAKTRGKKEDKASNDDANVPKQDTEVTTTPARKGRLPRTRGKKDNSGDEDVPEQNSENTVPTPAKGGRKVQNTRGKKRVKDDDNDEEGEDNTKDKDTMSTPPKRGRRVPRTIINKEEKEDMGKVEAVENILTQNNEDNQSKSIPAKRGRTQRTRRAKQEEEEEEDRQNLPQQDEDKSSKKGGRTLKTRGRKEEKDGDKENVPRQNSEDNEDKPTVAKRGRRTQKTRGKKEEKDDNEVEDKENVPTQNTKDEDTTELSQPKRGRKAQKATEEPEVPAARATRRRGKVEAVSSPEARPTRVTRARKCLV